MCGCDVETKSHGTKVEEEEEEEERRQGHPISGRLGLGGPVGTPADAKSDHPGMYSSAPRVRMVWWWCGNEGAALAVPNSTRMQRSRVSFAGPHGPPHKHSFFRPYNTPKPSQATHPPTVHFHFCRLLPLELAWCQQTFASKGIAATPLSNQRPMSLFFLPQAPTTPKNDKKEHKRRKKRHWIPLNQ